MYKKIIASTSALMLALGSAGFVQNNFSAKADEEDYPYSPDYSYDDYVADTFGTGSEQENNSDDDSTKEIFILLQVKQILTITVISSTFLLKKQELQHSQ